MLRSALSIRLVLGILAIVAAGAVYGWMFLEVRGMRTEIAELSGTIEVRAQEEERLRAIENVLEATTEERIALARYFVEEDTVVSFIETLEGLGRSAGVDVTISSVDADDGGEQGATSRYLGVRMAIVGSWRNVMHFAALIDSLPFVTEVEQFDLNRGTADASTWQGQLSLQVAMLP